MSGATDGQERADRAPDAPQSHGWLRRSELDREDLEGWERPDGSIRLVEPRRRARRRPV